MEISHLGGVMVSMLAIGPKVCMFRLDQGSGFLRAIKIHTMPSFGGEVKPEVPCHKILWYVKITCKYEQKCLARPNSSFPSSVPPAFYQITGRIARGLVDESGIFLCQNHSIMVLDAHISPGG
jgi:hypothetical protein